MPWQQGRSGNPNGRPRAQSGTAAKVARAIQALTNDCDDLIKILIDEARKPAHTPRDQDRRLKVVEMLLDRAIGRPQQEIIASIAPADVGPVPLSALSSTDIEALERGLAPLVLKLIEPHDVSDPDAP